MKRSQETGSPQGHLRPRITLTTSDHERLHGLSRDAMSSMPEVATFLANELDRAHVLPPGQRRPDLVSMGSKVSFRDEATGKVYTATLVYPEDVDVAQRKISVLTPIGTALIGLGIGQSITWETRMGELRRLTVLQISAPESP